MSTVTLGWGEWEMVMFNRKADLEFFPCLIVKCNIKSGLTWTRVAWGGAILFVRVKVRVTLKQDIFWEQGWPVRRRGSIMEFLFFANVHLKTTCPVLKITFIIILHQRPKRMAMLQY